MTMNFFKRVMTFFSTLWNAILWRKPDKKAKQAAKYSKEGNLEERRNTESDLTTVSETEQLFVDIPLNPPERLLEKELFISDEIPDTSAYNTESRPAADIGIKIYSSGVQLFGFEDETCKSLSFFSEPTRDDTESETPHLSSKDKHGEHGAAENTVSETVLNGKETGAASEETVVGEETAVDEATVNQVDEVFDSQASEEFPTSPTDSISTCEDDFHDQKNLSELLTSALKVPSPSDNVPTQVTILNNEVLLETQPSLENLSSSAADRITVFQKSSINPDLSYLLAIGDEIHLFDHDAEPETFLNEKYGDREKMKTPQTYETPQLDGSHPISKQESSGTLETAAVVFEDVEMNEYDATSSNQVVPIRDLVSSTQSTSEAYEQAPVSNCQYSTNYVVKSDSLVNFLPESGSDHDDAADIADVLFETVGKSINHEDEKEIPPNHSSLLKEGKLEELMCTPRGILKLSGDHLFECTDVNDGTTDGLEQSNMKAAVDCFLQDAFEFEEPLLSTHQLEGCVLEETSLNGFDTEEMPLFREILKTVGLEDTDSVQGLDGTTNDEFDTTPGTIGRCSSVILDSPKLPMMSSRSKKDVRIKNRKPCQDKRDEDRKSPCRLSQFTAFHSDDDSDCIGHLKRDGLLFPGTPAVRYVEIPSRSETLDFDGSERDTDSSHLGHMDKSNSTNRCMDDSQSNNYELLIGPGWQVTLPSPSPFVEANGTPNHESVCLPFLSKHASPILGANNKSCHDVCVEESPETQPGDDMNDFFPFIDCSSYLFKIPEEIRKEPSFNPCVGAAPTRRIYTNHANLDSTRHDECDLFESNYPNMNSLVSNCVGAVPMVNPCIPDEYKSTRMGKLPDEYNQRPIPQNVGPFWGAHLGIPHPGDQQEAIVGYPLSCDGNYYEADDLNVPSAYEDDQTNICSDSEGYGYINAYGAVEFPLLSIPLCTPQSQSSVYMPSGPVSPIIFPIGPMNVPQNENLPSLVDIENPPQNEQYTIPHTWRGYTVNWQNDDEKEFTSMVEVRGLAPISENLSCTGTNDDDDDDEFDDSPIPNPYFQSLADNNSLHTVKSKADSYSGSLFCESLRSLISHNTENENLFPSFSCSSSVQGCCPSVVLPSCETTLSSDSLPSITVEETNYKRAEDDYLATEKFMNDVNTALNESVLDQIQGHLDLHCNLLGRGDGSLPVSPDERENYMETPENDVMLRNSLGENISINNSELTLLDGVLGTGIGGNQPDPPQNLWGIDSESSDSVCNYCRRILDSLVENVIVSSVDQSVELQVCIADRDANHRVDLDESLLQESTERDLIVQSMMFIEGVPDQVKQMWIEGVTNNMDNHDQKERIVTLDDASGVLDKIVGEASKNPADTPFNKMQASAADDSSNRKGRRKRRRKKKLSDVDSEVEPEPCIKVSDVAMGDANSIHHDQRTELNGNTAEERPSNLLKSGQNEADTSKSKAVGEIFATENKKESSNCEHDVAQIEEEHDGHQGEDEDPGGVSSNPSHNGRRRNRRRNRKN